jgi:hypothetical protein
VSFHLDLGFLLFSVVLVSLDRGILPSGGRLSLVFWVAMVASAGFMNYEITKNVFSFVQICQ